MRRRLIIAQLVLAGLGCIFLLPKTFGMRESALINSLPLTLGDWVGHPDEPSEQVRKTLAEDTIFGQSHYVRPTPGRYGRYDHVTAFLVFSGEDMNNSIHRPERCLHAQGFQIISGETVAIDVGRAKSLTARRVFSKTPNGAYNLTYYWFTGAKVITPSHYRRTFTDMIDRVLTGTNQRWAYATVATNFGFEEVADRPQASHDEATADAMVTEFIGQLFDRIHKTEQLGGDWSLRDS